MIHEDETDSNDGDDGASRPYKKLRSQRAPQRGLGVEKLEMLRCQSDKRSDSSSSCAPGFSSDSLLELQLQTHVAKPTAVNNTNTDLYGSSSTPLIQPAPLSLQTTMSHANLNSAFNSHMRNSLHPNLNRETEIPVPTATQTFRTGQPGNYCNSRFPFNQKQQHQYLYHPYRVSNPSSSGVINNLQIEHPSIQACSNNTSNIGSCLDEQKQSLGIKRPLQPYIPMFSGVMYRPQQSNPNCSPHPSIGVTTEGNHKVIVNANGEHLDGSFLTLGFSATSNPKPTNLSHRAEGQQLDKLSHQENMNNGFRHSGPPSIQPRRFYDFFSIAQVSEVAGSSDRTENVDIDLELKL